MGHEAHDDISGETDNKAKDSTNEGSDETPNLSEERDDLDLDGNDNHGEDRSEGTENEL